MQKLADKSLESYKSQLTEGILSRLGQASFREIFREEKTEILERAKELCERKYGTDDWKNRVGEWSINPENLRKDADWCFFYEDRNRKPTDDLRPIQNVRASEIFGAHEVVFFGNGVYDADMNFAINEELMNRSAKDGKFYFRRFEFERAAAILAASDDPALVSKTGNLPIEVSRSFGGGRPLVITKNGMGTCLSGPETASFNGQISINDSFGSIISLAITDMIKPHHTMALGYSGSTIRIDGKEIAGHSTGRLLGKSFAHQGYIRVYPWDLDRVLIENAIPGLSKEKVEEIMRLPNIKDLAENS